MTRRRANEFQILRWLRSFVQTPTAPDAREAAMSSYCELTVEQTSPIQHSEDGNFDEDLLELPEADYSYHGSGDGDGKGWMHV